MSSWLVMFADGPALKLAGVAERMKVVTKKLSLRQSPDTQP
jgi:hypothetical protein